MNIGSAAGSGVADATARLSIAMKSRVILECEREWVELSNKRSTVPWLPLPIGASEIISRFAENSVKVIGQVAAYTGAVKAPGHRRTEEPCVDLAQASAARLTLRLRHPKAAPPASTLPNSKIALGKGVAAGASLLASTLMSSMRTLPVPITANTMEVIPVKAVA